VAFDIEKSQTFGSPNQFVSNPAQLSIIGIFQTRDIDHGYIIGLNALYSGIAHQRFLTEFSSSDFVLTGHGIDYPILIESQFRCLPPSSPLSPWRGERDFFWVFLPYSITPALRQKLI
jgi:hypothetical protein